MTLHLSSIRERVEKATPGPWTADLLPEGHESIDWVIIGAGGNLSSDMNRDDAAFIAHARSDIPALLDEVERLRACRDVLLEMVSDGPVRVAFAGNPIACDRLAAKIRAVLSPSLLGGSVAGASRGDPQVVATPSDGGAS